MSTLTTIIGGIVVLYLVGRGIFATVNDFKSKKEDKK